jgi:uncharacterized membrane protein
MRRRWGTHAVIVLVLLLVAGIAVGDTGGSMGGGSWGGGGGGSYSGGGGSYSGGGGGWSSSSSGGGGWSSSSSSGGGWSSSSSHDSGGGWSSSGGGCTSSNEASGCTSIELGTLMAVLGVIVLLVVIGAIFGGGSNEAPLSDVNYGLPAGIDVSVIRVVIDGRARKFVQTELARIAKTADTKTDQGRALMLREVALMLRRLRDAWVYGGAVNHPMRANQREAKREFDKAVDDARSRFREEIIRNADGVITKRQASEYTPRSHEGAGVILVSLVLAARSQLFTIQRIHDGDELRQALESASQLTPNTLVAIEIVWQPAEETDRLSSMELEMKYPRPELIPISGAHEQTLGRRRSAGARRAAARRRRVRRYRRQHGRR